MNKRAVFLLLGGVAFLTVGIFVVACAPFQDSIFSDTLLRKERNLNVQMIAAIQNPESDGTIRIAVMADSHQNYKPLDDTINQINATADVDFVVNLGDFSNSAYNLEYDQFLKSFAHLLVPHVTIIGNHDALGAGPSLFHKAFGESNFWFETSSHRYVFWDSANLENPETFDPNWLLTTVNASTKPVIVFTHCSLDDPERFAAPDVASLMNQVIQKAQFVLNGHNHVYLTRTVLGTPLIQGPRVELGWMIIEIQGTNLKVTQMPTGQAEWFTLKP